MADYLSQADTCFEITQFQHFTGPNPVGAQDQGSYKRHKTHTHTHIHLHLRHSWAAVSFQA